MLTPAGNVGGCLGCTVSGWNGTTINGPISSLTVLDTLLSGSPNGSLFSLFICGIGSNGNIIDLGPDTTLCQGETLILVATTPNTTYLWQDNSTNPTFSVTQQGTYWVQAIENNCTVTDSVLIYEEDCEVILEMPNVFTPNNDGTNNLFVPIISNGIVSMMNKYH